MLSLTDYLRLTDDWIMCLYKQPFRVTSVSTYYFDDFWVELSRLQHMLPDFFHILFFLIFIHFFIFQLPQKFGCLMFVF